MKQNMKFSVCVTALNARETWANVSSALRNQTASPFEVLVLDFESSEGLRNLANEMDLVSRSDEGV